MGWFSGSSKSKQQVTPYRQPDLDQMLGRTWGLGNYPQQMFRKRMRAEMDPLQIEALGMREQYGRGLGGMVDPAMQAWQSTLSAPDVANNPYVQGMLEQQQNLLNRNLQENLLPSIRARSGMINERPGGSGLDVATGIAARGTQEALARQAAQTQMGAYTAGLGQQQFGLSAAPGMVGLGLEPSNVLMDVGDINRAERQARRDEAFQRWNFAQQEPRERLAWQANMYNTLAGPYAQVEAKGKETPSVLGMAGQVLGLGAAGAGLAGMLGGGGAPGLAGYAGSGAVPMPSMAGPMPGVPGGYGGALRQAYQIPMAGMGGMGSWMGPNNPMQRRMPYPY